MRKWDRRALEGLPLKLLMVSLLTSITTPAVLGGLEDYELSVVRSEMEAEAIRLGHLIEEVRSAGEGNRRSISLSLPSACERHHLSMEIGGHVGNSSSLSIRCMCEDKVFFVVVLDDPPARTTSSDLGPLRLLAGTYDLTLECLLVEDRLAIVVRTIG